MATKRITNGVLLEYMKGMKIELKQDITSLDSRMNRLEATMNRRFNEAQLHREALQEDLNATIKMVGKHEKTLARR